MTRARKPVKHDAPAPTVQTHGRLGIHSELSVQPANRHTHASARPRARPPARVRVSDPAKPPYRIPPMAEIAAIPDNGRRVASLFSGAGGSSLGYRLAGFRVLYANEFVPAARDTYRANFPTTHLDARDVRSVKPEEILAACGLAAGALDVLDGSPPCASFSTAGKRSSHWGKVKKYSDVAQRTDDLFFEFVRILAGVRPKTFVAENVSGLVKGVAKGYFKEILAALKAAGYRVAARTLDAQWLGVPQSRKRLIFVGVRDDLGVEPAHPRPLGYRYSVRDALPWIGAYTFDTSGKGWGGKPNRKEIDVDNAPSPAILANEIGMIHHKLAGDEPPVEPESSIAGFAIDGEYAKLRPGESSDRYFNLVRPSAAEPSPTICASHGSPGMAGVTHPTERRKFSIAELRRICGFPDDFALTGTYAQQWERLGRAVPPPMMAAVAATVRDEVLARCAG